MTMCETCQTMKINNDIRVCMPCGLSFCVECVKLHGQSHK
jgi:hypothetical protein